jgi:hypothetical protein
MIVHVLSWVYVPSQYPHEATCLFAPMTGIEVQGMRVEGAVLIVEARLSINLNVLTIEQVQSGGVCVEARVVACYHAHSRIVRCERVLLTVEQVVSKRCKVVADMVNNMLAKFGRGLEEDAAWMALGPSALGDAYHSLPQGLARAAAHRGARALQRGRSAQRGH